MLTSSALSASGIEEYPMENNLLKLKRRTRSNSRSSQTF